MNSDFNEIFEEISKEVNLLIRAKLISFDKEYALGILTEIKFDKATYQATSQNGSLISLNYFPNGNIKNGQQS